MKQPSKQGIIPKNDDDELDHRRWCVEQALQIKPHLGAQETLEIAQQIYDWTLGDGSEA